MVNLITFATKDADGKYVRAWGVWIQHLEQRKSCCCTICAPLHIILLLWHCLPSPGKEKSEAGVSHVNRDCTKQSIICQLTPAKGTEMSGGGSFYFKWGFICLWSCRVPVGIRSSHCTFPASRLKPSRDWALTNRTAAEEHFPRITIWKEKGELCLYFGDFSCAWCFEEWNCGLVQG